MHFAHRYYCLFILKILATPFHFRFAWCSFWLCISPSVTCYLYIPVFLTSAVYSELVLAYAIAITIVQCGFFYIWSTTVRAKYSQRIYLLTYCCRPGAAQNAVGGVLQRYGQPSLTNQEYMDAFNQIQWTQQQVNSLENSLQRGRVFTYCISSDLVST